MKRPENTFKGVENLAGKTAALFKQVFDNSSLQMHHNINLFILITQILKFIIGSLCITISNLNFFLKKFNLAKRTSILKKYR